MKVKVMNWRGVTLVLTLILGMALWAVYESALTLEASMGQEATWRSE